MMWRPNTIVVVGWAALAANMYYEWIPSIVDVCRHPILDLGIVVLTVFTAVSYFMFTYVGWKSSKMLLNGAEIASRSQIMTIAFTVVLIAGFLVMADFAVGLATGSENLFILEAIYDMVRDPSGYQSTISQSLQFTGPENLTLPQLVAENPEITS